MKTFFLSLLMMSSIILQAQKKMPILLRGDFGLSNVKTNNGKGSISFAGAVGLETFLTIVPLGDDLTLDINPNLSYLHTGYESSGGGKVNVNYISLGLPLTFVINGGKRDDAGLSIGAGPFLNFAASGRFRNLSIDDFRSMSFGNGTADNRKSTDAGLLLKSAVRVSRLYLGTQYNYGLSNVIPKDRMTGGNYIKTRNFLFFIAYNISK